MRGILSRTQDQTLAGFVSACAACLQLCWFSSIRMSMVDKGDVYACPDANTIESLSALVAAV